MPDFTKHDIEMISSLETLFQKHRFNIRDDLGQLKPISELIGFAVGHFSKEQMIEFSDILSPEV